MKCDFYQFFVKKKGKLRAIGNLRSGFDGFEGGISSVWKYVG